MYFLCETGETSNGPGTEVQLHIWRADNFIFFSSPGGGMHSLQIEDAELIEFCQFLERAVACSEYIEYTNGHDATRNPLPYIAFEDEDEGTRNLCLRDTRLYCIFNLKVQHLLKMAVFLRKHIK